MCHACQYDTTKKWSHETTNTGSVVGTPQSWGDFVSVDQMITGNPSLTIPFDSDHPSTRWYKLVTMWVDHFSHFLHAHCQEEATIQSTLDSKEDFEMFAKCYNVRIKHIYSDNGVFMMKAFKDYVTINSNHFAVSAHIGRMEWLSDTEARSCPIACKVPTRVWALFHIPEGQCNWQDSISVCDLPLASLWCLATISTWGHHWLSFPQKMAFSKEFVISISGMCTLIIAMPNYFFNNGVKNKEDWCIAKVISQIKHDMFVVLKNITCAEFVWCAHMIDNLER